MIYLVDPGSCLVRIPTHLIVVIIAATIRVGIVFGDDVCDSNVE